MAHYPRRLCRRRHGRLVDAELCRGERPGMDGKLPASRPVHNGTALWREMEANLFEPPFNGDAAAWSEVGDRLDALRLELPAALPRLLAEECNFALDLSRWIDLK